MYAKRAVQDRPKKRPQNDVAQGKPTGKRTGVTLAVSLPQTGGFEAYQIGLSTPGAVPSRGHPDQQGRIEEKSNVGNDTYLPRGKKRQPLDTTDTVHDMRWLSFVGEDASDAGENGRKRIV